jgi:hypothetical protein
MLLAFVNLLIVAPLFAVEYSAYNGSVEWTFMAISRIMAKYPGQWRWWPFWNGGQPFENAYLPLSHGLIAGFHLLTGISIARSFHLVTAGFYVLSTLTMFWMALELSRRLIASLIGALAYSCISISALLIPEIGVDAGSALNLRRLQILTVYGESPHTVALALLPVAIVCFSRAVATRSLRWQILAGLSAAAVVLSNAFGIVMLAIALVCWLIAFPARPWWRPPLLIGITAIVTWCWISPWLSPAMIRATRAHASTTAGDYRYTHDSYIALAAVSAGFLLLVLILRRIRMPAYLRFFVLCGGAPAAIALLHYLFRVAIIPQPHRYQLEMDMFLPFTIVFVCAAMLDRVRPRVRMAIAAVTLAALGLQTIHAALYSRELIRSADPSHLSEFRIAKWLDRNRPGERAYLTGSASFLYTAFTDNPQLAGGPDQHIVNGFIRVVSYTINSGANAGDRDADYSIFWLKAFGTPLIAISGPGSTDAYQPIVHPRKFDGVLPLLWRDGGDSIYEVPMRSASLAHVIPESAIVTRTPIHGLDIAPVEPYVAALEDPAYPAASFRWTSMSDAEIDAAPGPGEVLSVQISYERGWEAWANGRSQQVSGDAIGQMVIRPDCNGPCHIALRYTGGWERYLTRIMSLGAMFVVFVAWWRARRRRDYSRPAASR